MTDDLYETKDGIQYYRGLCHENLEEHKAKCEACGLFPKRILFAHGQVIQTMPWEWPIEFTLERPYRKAVILPAQCDVRGDMP